MHIFLIVNITINVIFFQNFQDLGATVEWVDATQMIEEMRVDVQNVLSWKRLAVEVS